MINDHLPVSVYSSTLAMITIPIFLCVWRVKFYPDCLASRALDFKTEYKGEHLVNSLTRILVL
jgi:hypothetical protein